MVLDDFKRALGRVSQKEPMKVAAIKESARNMGMNMDEYILHLGNLALQPPQQQFNVPDNNSNELQAELQQLRADLATLKASQQFMPPQVPPALPVAPIAPVAAPGLIDQVKDIATIMSTFKEMFPQQNIKDMIDLVKGVDELRADVSMEGAEPDMGLIALRELMPMLPQILKSRSSSKEILTSPEKVTESSVTAKATVGGDSNQGEPPLKEATAMDIMSVKNQIKDKLPEVLKNAIQNGDLGLDQIKEELHAGLKAKGYSVDLLPAGLVEEIYDEIKLEGTPGPQPDLEEDDGREGDSAAGDNTAINDDVGDEKEGEVEETEEDQPEE